MSEKQETVYVILRQAPRVPVRPIKVFDDRSDARAYVKRMNLRKGVASYSVAPTKQG